MSRNQIEQLFKRARPIKTRYFSCRLLPNNSLSTAVIVGKTISNKATVRNRLRRQLKAALQKIEQSKGVTGQLVVVVRQRFELTFDELLSELQQCFKA